MGRLVCGAAALSNARQVAAMAMLDGQRQERSTSGRADRGRSSSWGGGVVTKDKPRKAKEPARSPPCRSPSWTPSGSRGYPTNLNGMELVCGAAALSNPHDGGGGNSDAGWPKGREVYEWPRGSGEVIKLGSWCSTQRKAKKGKGSNKISAVQIAQLDAIGFPWALTAVRRKWGDWYVALRHYRAHGGGDGDAGWPTTNEQYEWPRESGEMIRLGRWCNNQRKAKKGKGTSQDLKYCADRPAGRHRVPVGATKGEEKK